MGPMSAPNPKDREVLDRWAQQEVLTIAELL
jgi:hypothetical protein